MTSFIITSTDKDRRKKATSDLCREFAVDLFDQTLLEKESDKEKTKTKQSLGIEEIRLLQEKIFLKPIKSKTKAVIIEDAQLLTTEAQNALLKVLEEPPEQTIIILGAESVEALLPTIISRCKVIAILTEQKAFTPKKKQNYIDFIAELPTMSMGARLKKAELLAKDKDKAIIWITDIILVLREQMLKCHSEHSASEAEESHTTNLLDQNSNERSFDSAQDDKKFYIECIRSFQDLHKLLKTTNVNARFAIEYTLLSLRV